MKYIIPSVVVQVALGQQIVESDIRNLMVDMSKELDDYMVSLAEGMEVYTSMIDDELQGLEDEKRALMTELENMDLELNTQGVDVSTCMDIATWDIDRIFTMLLLC